MGQHFCSHAGRRVEFIPEGAGSLRRYHGALLQYLLEVSQLHCAFSLVAFNSPISLRRAQQNSFLPLGGISTRGVRRGGNAIMICRAFGSVWHNFFSHGASFTSPSTWSSHLTPFQPPRSLLHTLRLRVYRGPWFTRLPHFFFFLTLFSDVFGMFLAAWRTVHVFRAHGTRCQELKMFHCSAQNSGTPQTSFQEQQ